MLSLFRQVITRRDVIKSLSNSATRIGMFNWFNNHKFHKDLRFEF